MGGIIVRVAFDTVRSQGGWRRGFFRRSPSTRGTRRHATGCGALLKEFHNANRMHDLCRHRVSMHPLQGKTGFFVTFQSQGGYPGLSYAAPSGAKTRPWYHLRNETFAPSNAGGTDNQAALGNGFHEMSMAFELEDFALHRGSHRDGDDPSSGLLRFAPG